MDVDAMLEESREMEELDRKKVERERKREEEETVQKSEEEKAEIRRAKERERRKRRKEEQDRLAGLGMLPAAVEAKKPAMEKAEQPYPCEFCPSTLKEDLVVIHAADKQASVRRAHRLCASFLPETWIAPSPTAKAGARASKDVVMGYEGIPRARWTIKCQTCKDPALQKRGAKVQCTHGRCSRTSHVSCALQEENGWKLDVLPEREADEIEGKGAAASEGKKGGAKTVTEAVQKQDADEADDDDEEVRMVVLCRTHNPEERIREAKRKAAVVREVLGDLVKGDKICIRTTSGVWETTFERFEPPAIAKDTIDEGEVVLIDGSKILGGKVVIDLATFRKADDKIWYREEAEWLQEEAERKRGKQQSKRKRATDEGGGESASVETAHENATEAVDDIEDSKAEDQVASIIQVASPFQVKKEEATGETKPKAKRQRVSAVVDSSDAIAVPPPIANANDGMQYIRDWRPRVHHDHPAPNVHPYQAQTHNRQPMYPTPYNNTSHDVRSWKPIAQHFAPSHQHYGHFDNRAAAAAPPLARYPVHPSYVRPPQPTSEMQFFQHQQQQQYNHHAEATARSNAWIAQQRYQNADSADRSRPF